MKCFYVFYILEPTRNFFKRILTHFSYLVWRKGKTAHFYRSFPLNPCNLDSFCFLHNNLCLKYKTSLTFLSTHLNSSCTGFIVNSNCEFELICIELCVNQKNYHCLIIKYLAYSSYATLKNFKRLSTLCQTFHAKADRGYFSLLLITYKKEIRSNI